MVALTPSVEHGCRVLEGVGAGPGQHSVAMLLYKEWQSAGMNTEQSDLRAACGTAAIVVAGNRRVAMVWLECMLMRDTGCRMAFSGICTQYEVSFYSKVCQFPTKDNMPVCSLLSSCDPASQVANKRSVT